MRLSSNLDFLAALRLSSELWLGQLKAWRDRFVLSYIWKVFVAANRIRCYFSFFFFSFFLMEKRNIVEITRLLRKSS